VFISQRNALFALLGLAGFGSAGCSSSGGPPPFDGPPARAVCTTTIVADVVQRVGGDRVTVQTLMGPGVDPHKYLPAPSDRAKLEQAHLVFYNGLHLEGKMVDTFEKAGGRMRAVAVTKTIDRSELRPADVDGGGEFDPHVWFDVRLWRKTVECVRDELAALDPAGADVYRRNAEAYLAELDALDREIREKLSRVPTEKRILVTSHDAFGYFGQAYGFQVKGLQGVSTASETGTRDRQDLAAFLGKNKVPAVFTETSVPSEGLQAVLDTTRKDSGHEVKLVGGDDALYSDALGPPGSPGATYPGMVRHNVSVIVDALTK
jgi:manganese/zinc/iron transport system substrate-binding protein